MNTNWLYFLFYKQNTKCVYNTLSIPFMILGPSQNSVSTTLEAMDLLRGDNHVKQVCNDYIIVLSVHKSIHFSGTVYRFTQVAMMAQYLYYIVRQTKQLKL